MLEVLLLLLLVQFNQFLLMLANAPIYGTRLRLKSTTDISGLTSDAQVIANALKQYGMLLADGGNIALTAASDAFTTTKWSDLNVPPQALQSLQVQEKF